MSVQLNETLLGNPSVDAVFGTAMPDNTMLYFFTPPSGPYVRYIYYEGWGWYDLSDKPVGTNEIVRGRGFWVNVPTAYTGTVVNLTVVGEVPDANMAPTTIVHVANGFALVGYPYPVSQPLTNAVFAASATDNDVIYFWNGANYVRYIFYAGYGWYDMQDNPANLVLQPGVGYWYRSTTTADLVEPKPYLWP
jgi:hypothetical protein